MKQVTLGLLLAALSGGVFAQGPEATTGTSKEVAGGSAQGAAAPATTMIGPIPAWAVGLGIGAAAFGIMIADERDDDKTTTNH
ncbi:MAG TPA: hypothetical protein VJT81_12850 [Burkholderiales bacterium]|nr:hypothetical protein [Burkholderiales bacterium]